MEGCWEISEVCLHRMVKRKQEETYPKLIAGEGFEILRRGPSPTIRCKQTSENFQHPSIIYTTVP